MKTAVALLGLAALAGAGYVVAKKFMDKQNDDTEPKAYAKATCNEKLQKASLFAVGAIKTGADKVVEGLNDIANKDMVQKGQETVDQVVEIKDNIKDEIDDLKNMVVSINIGVGDEEPEEDGREFNASTADEKPREEESAVKSAFGSTTELADDMLEDLTEIESDGFEL